MHILKTHIRTLCILFVLVIQPLSGQTDYSWWNEKHDWDRNALTLAGLYRELTAQETPSLCVNTG